MQGVTLAELQQLADEDLMPLVAEKDPDAFEVFYDRHGGAAFSLAYRIVGDRQAAEDVTQEALISIWRSGARFDRAKGSVRAWTLGIVRNRAIDLLRRDAGRAPKLAFDPTEALERRPAEELTDVEALRRETAREVRGVLSGLPEDQSRVIQLAFFGGFSHSEIAKMLNEPLGTIKGRMRLGMDKIRATLAEAVHESGAFEG
jgi:RNA polymerase sigma-70 factor (ECF subfamily)